MALRDKMHSFLPGSLLTKCLRSLTGRTGFPGTERQRLKMPVLQTERLVLRQFQQEDLKDLVHWQKASGAECTESEAQGFLDFCFREYGEWGIGPWGLLLRKTGSVVGSCSFCYIHPYRKSGEVNYYVTPQYRGQGLAPEALKAVLEFGFGDLQLARIEARCPPDNASSERVIQKAGMNFERMISSSAASKESSDGDKLFAVVRRDFKPQPSR